MIPNGPPAIPMETAPPPAAPAPPPMYAPPPMKPSRPIGVAILAILTILFGIIALFGGLAFLGLAGLGIVAGAGPLAAFLGIIGAIIVLFGIVQIVAGWGLWKLRPWAWWLATIVSALSVIVNGVLLNWVGLALALIILIYLFVVRKSFMPRPMGM